jgi:hypothetical protein
MVSVRILHARLFIHYWTILYGYSVRSIHTVTSATRTSVPTKSILGELNPVAIDTAADTAAAVAAKELSVHGPPAGAGRTNCEARRLNTCYDLLGASSRQHLCQQSPRSAFSSNTAAQYTTLPPTVPTWSRLYPKRHPISSTPVPPKLL